MDTWSIIFIYNLIGSILMIVFGIRFLRYRPKLNGICGIRIKKAMTNGETWDFANEYCGRLWRNVGGIMFLIIVIVMPLFINFSEFVIKIVGLIISILQCGVFFSTIKMVDKALDKKFDNLEKGEKL